MLVNLGIDPAQPAEIYQAGPSQDGKVLYEGFFHLVGRLLAGDRERMAEAEDGFCYFLHDAAARVPKVFATQPVVQFEFHVPLPWVLPGTCPP